MLNAMRRNNVVESPYDDWLRNLALTLVSGIGLAAVVTLVVVATYKRAPRPWRWPALVAAVVISSSVGTLLLFLIDTVGTFKLDEATDVELPAKDDATETALTMPADVATAG